MLTEVWHRYEARQAKLDELLCALVVAVESLNDEIFPTPEQMRKEEERLQSMYLGELMGAADRDAVIRDLKAQLVTANAAIDVLRKHEGEQHAEIARLKAENHTYLIELDEDQRAKYDPGFVA